MNGVKTSLQTGRCSADTSLVVCDVDGTLIRHDKVLTPRSIEAVRELRAAKIRFTLASSRPPKGLLAMLSQLQVDEPFAAFNGAVIMQPGPELTPIFSKFLDPDI